MFWPLTLVAFKNESGDGFVDHLFESAVVRVSSILIAGVGPDSRFPGDFKALFGLRLCARASGRPSGTITWLTFHVKHAFTRFTGAEPFPNVGT